MRRAAQSQPQFAPVLFVDDDHITRVIAEAYLRASGTEFIIASNGEQAMQFLKTMSFSLVITDIVMPAMDGFELISWIKASGIATPVGAVSGMELADDVRCSDVATCLGADFGMRKPITQTKIDMALMFRKSDIGEDWVEQVPTVPSQAPKMKLTA